MLCLYLINGKGSSQSKGDNNKARMAAKRTYYLRFQRAIPNPNPTNN